MPIQRFEIVSHLNSLLNIVSIPDVSCNGLQVEGAGEISTIGLAVDACMSVFKKAHEAGCQMVLVHHGIIWGGLTAITGACARNLEFLLRNNMNLYAAHLPLDLHPKLGNNILLAQALGLTDCVPFGRYKGLLIGFQGRATEAMSAADIGKRLLNAGLAGNVSILPFGPEANTAVAVVSGGGSDTLAEAIDKKIDCLITGEPLHWNHHTALEGGINVVYGGHYHTETGGIKALGNHLEKKFGVKAVFIDEPTLV